MTSITITKQGNQIKRSLIFPLPGNEDTNFTKEVALELKDFLKKHRWKIKKTLVGITGKYLNIRYFWSPTSSLSRLPAVVQMEVKQTEEKIGSTLSYSYTQPANAPCMQKEGILIAMALVHDNYLNTIYNFFRFISIDVIGFIPNPMALYQALEHFSYIPSGQNIYLIDIGKENTSLVICAESGFKFYRNIHTGMQNSLTRKQVIEQNDKNVQLEYQDDTDHSSEETLQKLLQIMDATQKFALVQTGLKITKIHQIVLTGGGTYHPNILSTIAKSYNASIEIWNPKINVDNMESWEKEQFIQHQQQYITSIALSWLATQSKKEWLILSSQQEIKQTLLGKRLFEYIALGIMLICLLFTIPRVLSSTKTLQEKDEQIKQKYTILAQRITDIQALQETINILKKKWAYLSMQLQNNQLFAHTMAWIEENQPKPITLTKFQWIQKETNYEIQIQGYVTETTEDVYQVLKEYRDQIQAYPHYSISEETNPTFLSDERKLKFSWTIQHTHQPKQENAQNIKENK